jgi:hypothetical protein
LRRRGERGLRDRRRGFFESPTVVTCFHDVAVVSQAVEQCGRHLCIAEHAGPFTEREIGGDDDGGALVKPADEMEQQLAAGSGERQVAEFVEDEEVHVGQMIGDPVDAGEYYSRVAPFFETASPKYDWLNRIVPVGVGQRGPTDVSYTVHELL